MRSFFDWLQAAAAVVTLFAIPLALHQLYASNLSAAKQLYAGYLASTIDAGQSITSWERADTDDVDRDVYEATVAQLIFACEELAATKVVPHYAPHWEAWEKICVSELNAYCGYLQSERFRKRVKNGDYTSAANDLIESATPPKMPCLTP